MIALIVVIVVVGVVIQSRTPQLSEQEYLQQAKRSLRRGDFAAAIDAAEQAIQLNGQSTAGLLFAADAAAQLGQQQAALDYCLRIPDSEGRFSLDARILTATLYQSHYNDRAAEEHLERALQISPDHPMVLRQLASSLSVHGRRWESIPYLLKLVQIGHADVADLRLLAAPESVKVLDEARLEAWASETDAYNQLAAACSLIALEQDFGRAESLLIQAIKSEPQLLEAHLRHGSLLADRGEVSMLDQWSRTLPDSAEAYPETWVIRADWNRLTGDAPNAAACYQRALEVHPNHVAANYQMGQVLTQLGDSKGKIFLNRAERLREIIKLSSLLSRRLDGALILNIVDELEAVGRLTEALAWLQLGTLGSEQHARHKRLVQLLSTKNATHLPWTLEGAYPTRHTSYSVQDWRPDSTRSADAAKQPTASQISFENVAASVGLSFRYQCGAPPQQRNHTIYEVTGGGVAAIDFDRDDWPDLYFAQAGTKPPFTFPNTHSDQLHRNRRGTAFIDATATANIQEAGFGQGVAAGDINNDGFPDLYVANVEGNRLFLNNGDGTFRDDSESVANQAEQWTTSCAIADLDGDSNPDLYDANYVGGDLLNLTCPKNGTPETCSPLKYQCVPDVLWVNDGSGRFQDRSADFKIPTADGDGLGLLVGAFANAPARIFVANDGRANFYLTPGNVDQGSERGRTKFYQQDSLVRGIALDSEGRAQACMGVAAADFDGDLRTDLFVTNYYAESNTLYLQTEDERFHDQSRVRGLYESSLKTLGFGTQAIDADLDGWPDLIIANGHLNEHPSDAPQQRMLPQFYRNINGETFSLLTSQTLGHYFGRPAIGRSMALLDWNHDGRSDVVVSHLEDPVALLQNTTPSISDFLAVRLTGRTSSRDAVGARVLLTTPDATFLKLVTAGDGYQCSNQKQLIFALGQSSENVILQITWPTGKTQTFSDLRPGSHVDLCEDMPQAFVRPKT